MSSFLVIHIFVLIGSTEFDELTLTNGVSGANYQCQVSLWTVDKSNDWLSAAVGKSDTPIYTVIQLNTIIQIYAVYKSDTHSVLLPVDPSFSQAAPQPPAALSK